jgi:hypothetical protein
MCVWMVDPIAKTVEVFLLDTAARWVLLGTWRDDAKVRVDPFAAVELELATLWSHLGHVAAQDRDAARVAAHADHVEQARRTKAWMRLERVVEKRPYGSTRLGFGAKTSTRSAPRSNTRSTTSGCTPSSAAIVPRFNFSTPGNRPRASGSREASGVVSARRGQTSKALDV